MPSDHACVFVICLMRNYRYIRTLCMYMYATYTYNYVNIVCCKDASCTMTDALKCRVLLQVRWRCTWAVSSRDKPPTSAPTSSCRHSSSSCSTSSQNSSKLAHKLQRFMFKVLKLQIIVSLIKTIAIECYALMHVRGRLQTLHNYCDMLSLKWVTKLV